MDREERSPPPAALDAAQVAAPAAGTDLLVLDHVSAGYDAGDVVRAVSFRIAEGDFWFFLGPNGSGKTTLLRTILGLLPARAGSLRRRPDIAGPERLGFVPQRCDLNPSLPTTVKEFVSLGLVGLPRAHRSAVERMEWALARCGLSGLARKSYWSLSGGQKQRALLARALIRRPALFLVDEPTSGLDRPSQDLLMDSLEDLNRRERLTIIFVTHDLPLAARHGTHVALFAAGGVVAGPAGEVLRPQLLERAYGLPIDVHAEARKGRP